MKRAVGALGCALLLLGATPGLAAPSARSQRGAVVGPVRLVPDTSIPIEVAGLNAYFGTIVLSPAADGLTVIDRLSIERYLLGLKEVPSDWPMQALKAQAVAARTYAMWTLDRPPAGAAATYGFDICASVECQVFSGAEVVLEDPAAHRWVAAVTATEGEVVTYGGDPILARYHSTSGGQTFDNETIFPSEGAFPYLKAVESTTEEGSPLYRWSVAFRLDRLTRIMAKADLWGPGKIRKVRSVPSSEGKHYPDLVFSGIHDRVRVTAEEFRVAARTIAPEQFPRLYPSLALTSSGRLPEVLPSNRYEATTRNGHMIVTGRGWGHGVGMSQWGAEGLARRGGSYTEILSHYYTGIDISEIDTSSPIDVGVAWGLNPVSVTGSFDVYDGRGRRIVKGALGTWRFRRTPSGAIAVAAPKGHRLALSIGVVSSPVSVEPGGTVEVVAALTKPARVSIGDQPPEVHDAGRLRLRLAAPEEPGNHEIEVTATDGERRRSDRFELTVVEDPKPEVRAQRAEQADPDETGAIRSVALGLLVVAALMWLVKVTMYR
ncbi:MAG: SpoIID/LytB domain-containing protein [Actinomycetota bacterium]